ncbi:MAG: hypothetical protein WDN10_05360 [bacterium]
MRSTFKAIVAAALMLAPVAAGAEPDFAYNERSPSEKWRDEHITFAYFGREIKGTDWLVIGLHPGDRKVTVSHRHKIYRDWGYAEVFSLSVGDSIFLEPSTAYPFGQKAKLVEFDGYTSMFWIH